MTSSTSEPKISIYKIFRSQKIFLAAQKLGRKKDFLRLVCNGQSPWSFFRKSSSIFFKILGCQVMKKLVSQALDKVKVLECRSPFRKGIKLSVLLSLLRLVCHALQGVCDQKSYEAERTQNELSSSQEECNPKSIAITKFWNQKKVSTCKPVQNSFKCLIKVKRKQNAQTKQTFSPYIN